MLNFKIGLSYASPGGRPANSVEGAQAPFHAYLICRPIHLHARHLPVHSLITGRHLTLTHQVHPATFLYTMCKKMVPLVALSL